MILSGCAARSHRFCCSPSLHCHSMAAAGRGPRRSRSSVGVMHQPAAALHLGGPACRPAAALRLFRRQTAAHGRVSQGARAWRQASPCLRLHPHLGIFLTRFRINLFRRGRGPPHTSRRLAAAFTAATTAAAVGATTTATAAARRMWVLWDSRPPSHPNGGRVCGVKTSVCLRAKLSPALFGARLLRERVPLQLLVCL